MNTSKGEESEDEIVFLKEVKKTKGQADISSKRFKGPVSVDQQIIFSGLMNPPARQDHQEYGFGGSSDSQMFRNQGIQRERLNNFQEGTDHDLENNRTHSSQYQYQQSDRHKDFWDDQGHQYRLNLDNQDVQVFRNESDRRDNRENRNGSDRRDRQDIHRSQRQNDHLFRGHRQNRQNGSERQNRQNGQYQSYQDRQDRRPDNFDHRDSYNREERHSRDEQDRRDRPARQDRDYQDESDDQDYYIDRHQSQVRHDDQESVRRKHEADLRQYELDMVQRRRCNTELITPDSIVPPGYVIIPDDGYNVPKKPKKWYNREAKQEPERPVEDFPPHVDDPKRKFVYLHPILQDFDKDLKDSLNAAIFKKLPQIFENGHIGRIGFYCYVFKRHLEIACTGTTEQIKFARRKLQNKYMAVMENLLSELRSGSEEAPKLKILVKIPLRFLSPFQRVHPEKLVCQVTLFNDIKDNNKVFVLKGTQKEIKQDLITIDEIFELVKNGTIPNRYIIIPKSYLTNCRSSEQN